ncbi:MAG: zinc carboxypeptidase, partial [candidate division Zixibacteria bacterium]|nr:zinc carboxypeptidase [candidate division Zixibacteria bacterium]
MNSKWLLSVALGVLFILLLISSVYANELYHQISIDVKNSEGVRNILSLGIDPSGMQYDPEKGTLDIALSESELREVESLGYNYIITIPDLVSYYASRSDGLDMGGYRTYSEVVTDLNTMVSSYPGYTRLIDIGHTHRDSVIWALKISDNPYMDENEPEVLYTGLTHAREPIGMECCMDFAEWLLSNYGSDPTATDLVDNREIWIIPIINVDGYIYNQEQSPNGGGMWRKNRRDNGGSYGVDPNRN